MTNPSHTRAASTSLESDRSYKRTLFDRHGPDAAIILKAGMYGATTFMLSVVLFSAAAMKMNPPLPPLATFVWIFACSAASAALASVVGLGTATAAGAVAKQVTMGGSSTPYKEQYSYQQALVMRGELDEALRSFESVIAEQPEAIDPRIKAAELYAREKGNHRRAAELFREVQGIASVTPGEDIYATHRLVDLLTGPLADPGRALVELRRLIDRHPASPAASHAATALSVLKARVHGET